mmetsp:Transcript_10802/g.16588  ORF Transcript_10802/g.16588 Transcript_10802/m.16588 type:complete len:152 (-) Transcript_10802:2596-3051(-)
MYVNLYGGEITLKCRKQHYLNAIGENQRALRRVGRIAISFGIFLITSSVSKGVHGQHVWVDYDANVVVAKFSSNPTAAGGILMEQGMVFHLSRYFQEEFNRPSKDAKKKPQKTKKRCKKVNRTQAFVVQREESFFVVQVRVDVRVYNYKLQ